MKGLIGVYRSLVWGGSRTTPTGIHPADQQRQILGIADQPDSLIIRESKSL